ncbi:MAG TPA: STAS domain-containing protein [Armatimonadota bacterium]|jgi:anti-sigma B factor antagonist
MKVSARNEEWLVVVEVAGELDAATAPALRAILDEQIHQGARWLLVDLQAVDLIASVGVGELIRSVNELNSLGGDLAVICRRPNVLRVFEISGTGELLHVRQAEAEARAALEQARQRQQSQCARAGGEDHGQA